MKRIYKISTLLAIAFALAGCFKDVVDYTSYNTAVYSQQESNGEITLAQNIEAYAFYVDTTEWRIASYEDAVAHRITHKESGKTLEEPDVVGTYDALSAFPSSLLLKAPTSMLVIVNYDLKLYAYRKFILPENLPKVDTKLYMLGWHRSGKTSDWMVVNQFYAEEPKTE